jgi:hypothetical protein
MSKRPDELPEEIPIAALRWLLGDLTTEYLNQLQRQGLITKSSRGRYPIQAVQDYVLAMRQRALGPTEFNNARVDLMRERVLAAKMARLEKEGELLSRAVVGVIITAIFTMVREKLLGLGTRVAAQCHLAGSVPTVQQIIDAHVREALESISESSQSEVMQRIDRAAEARHGGRGRKAAV